ncbi:agmatinase [Pseudogracilibacillus auburnensis]|uniref:agmatinase n=1 Tax=Pseudogracilibacillus auburnensis TaxID=1494959 RepID=UPI001A97D1B9|nr:agmatinase [Pseudogracilibacillus auburnensis]MBO1006024.1 agmatinase [Pseudogracilibacillus auburnensis]
MTKKEKLNLPYTGISSFAKYPICTDLDELEADVAILGAPYDMATQYRSGAKMGPRGIRESSTLYGIGINGAYDFEKDDVYLGPPWKIVDCGDADMIHGDLDQSLGNIEDAVRKIVEKGAIPVVLGGDHSITIPVAKGLEKAGPFTVVQIDAHLDFADERMGQRYGHGSPMRRMSEMEHVEGMAQLGIRGIGSSSKEDFEDAKNYGSVIISTRKIRELGIEKVLEMIPDSERYFVTIDIDGLDSSLTPGTGSPSPGGLYYYETSELLEGIAKKGNVIGFDLVEVAPPYDVSGMTSQLASRLILDFLGFILKEKEKEKLSK